MVQMLGHMTLNILQCKLLTLYMVNILISGNLLKHCQDPIKNSAFSAPYQKMAITPKDNDPKEPKICYFSYISMTNPPIPFLGLKLAKKGFL